MATAVLGAGNATIEFNAHEGVCGAGVLFLLPALLLQGLLKTKEVYKIPESHYYGLESIVLTLAFMALGRIKNPEQLKQCKPGEIGKIIGLDRIPEVRCLRDKINLLTNQNQAQKLNQLLIDHWYSQPTEETSFLYIDGHVRIYFGHQAKLPSKFVSRQKLCLSATTEYWVNDAAGLPVMMVSGELTEKLQKAIEDYIIPELQKTLLLPSPSVAKEIEVEATEIEAESVVEIKEATQNASGQKEDPLPVCTLVFDREAYEPAFFKRLYKEHRIAILTYRKNVKDIWPEEWFKAMDIKVLDQTVTMRICERETVLGGVPMREIRRLTDSGHQTAIITTNHFISTEVAAGRMFGRWSQENFFRYMIMDYDFDKMIEYGTEAIDENNEVVNPEHRRLSYRLKKEKEKTARLKARLFPLTEEAIETSLDDMPALQKKQIKLMEQIEQHQQTEQQIMEERSKIPARIKLKNMPDQARYNKLKPQSKMLMNIMKMICYRAETAVANELSAFLINAKEEKRMLVKQIIQNNADLIPDYQSKTLTVVLHSLSAPRFNAAAEKLAEVLNQTETIFPGTDLMLKFKTSAFSHCEK
jgi:acetolactate synthase small subunit